MKISKVMAPALAVVALAVAGIGQADAASVSQTITFASGSTNYDALESFNLFDSSAYGGATLDSVVVSYSFGTANANFQFKNTGGAGSTVTGTGYTASSFVSLDFAALNVASATGTSTTIPNFTLTRNQSTSALSVAGVSVGGTNTYTSVGDLASFLGTGTDSFEATATSSTNGTVSTSGSGSLTAIYAALASGSATITYNYTPVSTVPEPESYAMLLAGLAAIGVVARRRRLS